MNVLSIENINQESFSPFGDIIEKTNANKKLSINQGTTIRHSEISKLNLNTNNGDSYISIFSGKPRKFPIEINLKQEKFDERIGRAYFRLRIFEIESKKIIRQSKSFLFITTSKK